MQYAHKFIFGKMCNLLLFISQHMPINNISMIT